MKPTNLNINRWLRLCRQAEQAALLIVPNVAAKDLPVMAGRLTTITEPLTSAFMTSLATSFRWDCTAFGLADAEKRAIMADGLKAKAVLLRTMLDPQGEPDAASLPVPDFSHQPAWQSRADIGG